jgi:acetylornithine deacetylase/succinyl-diaminopimelate desuccinylase-like protein
MSLATVLAGIKNHVAARSWAGKAIGDLGDAVASYIKFIGSDDNATTAGGAAAEVVTVSGAAVGDKVVWGILDDGTNNVTGVSAVAGSGNVTFTFSGDPGNDTIISYMVLRSE